MAQSLTTPSTVVATTPPICSATGPQQAGPVAGTSNAETQAALGLGAPAEVDFMAEMASEYGGGEGGGSLAAVLPYLGSTAPVALDAVGAELAFAAAAENLDVPSVWEWVQEQSVRDLFSVPSSTVLKLLDAFVPDGTYADVGISAPLGAALGASVGGDGGVRFARDGQALVSTVSCKADAGVGVGADFSAESSATGREGILFKCGASAGAQVEAEWRVDLRKGLAWADGLAGTTLGGLGLAAFFHGAAESLLTNMGASVPSRLTVAARVGTGFEGQVGGAPDPYAPVDAAGAGAWDDVKRLARTGLAAAAGTEAREGAGWEGLRGTFFIEASWRAEALVGATGNGETFGGDHFVRLDVKSPTLGGEAPTTAAELMQEGLQVRVTTGVRTAGEEESTIQDFAALPDALAAIAGFGGDREHAVVGQLVDGRKHRVRDLAAVEPILAGAGLDTGLLGKLGAVEADVEVVINELAVGISNPDVDRSDEEECRDEQRDMGKAIFGVGDAELAVEHDEAWELRKAEVDVRAGVGATFDDGSMSASRRGAVGRKVDLADQLTLEQVAELLIA